MAGSRFGHDNLSEGNGTEDSCGGRFCSEDKRFHLTVGVSSNDPISNALCAPGFRLIDKEELLGGQLSRYDGGGAQVGNRIRVGGTRYEMADGGGTGTGLFACEDTNDIGNGQSGFVCDNIA